MSIRCNNCGKMIPYHGQVCPYCQADKSAEKRKLETIGYWGLGGGFVTFIATLAVAFFTSLPPASAFCVAFAGAIAGMVVGSVVVSARR